MDAISGKDREKINNISKLKHFLRLVRTVNYFYTSVRVAGWRLIDAGPIGPRRAAALQDQDGQFPGVRFFGFRSPLAWHGDASG